MSVILRLKDIKKDYKVSDTFVHALKGINLSFRQNEFVSILGPSGCGKTTMLNIIGGLDRYTSGDLEIKGQSTTKFKSNDWDTYRNHSIGFVFQSYNLIPHLSILGNVELALTIGGVSTKERRKRAKEVLDRVGLAGQYKKKPNQLSGGQMQRVAIARALVNNPEILLADEPTGALDSETSVQIMDLIREISKERLVIMVTHNQDIAEKYSTRIIKLLDGEIIGDNNPPTEEEEKEEIVEETQISKGKKKKSSMSIFTAFSLSFKNLLTKRARTILTSFAGSIGIVGVALVLAISNGFTSYIDGMQKDTLGGYPIAISTVAVDYSALTSAFTGGEGEQKSDTSINVYNSTEMLAKLGNYNFMSGKFLDYIDAYIEADAKKNENDKELSAVQKVLATNMKILTKSGEKIKKIDTSISNNSIAGTTSSLFYEGMSDKNFVLDNYEIVSGKYPENKHEVLLVLDSTNSMSTKMLNDLGISYTMTDGVYNKIEYSDIVGKKTFKLLTNDQYYIPEYNGEEITKFSTISESDYQAKFDQAETLTICGIMRPKEDIVVEMFDSGIMYLPELASDYIENSKQSLIAKTSVQNKKLYEPFVLDISELGSFGMGRHMFETPEQISSFVKSQYNIDMTIEEAVELGLQSVGASSIPTGILLYPKDFDGKESVINLIEDWNKSENGKTNKIVYSDPSEVLTGTLGELINIISYVLIAFAAISLLVSSIMIGIITYVSVVERTKEIGVLRSIGARKKDVARVFNAETFIIGLMAGLIGVLMTLVLCIPINAIIESVSGGLQNIAVLKFTHALILIGISFVLTLIAGLIPARIASKKDPVVALRMG